MFSGKVRLDPFILSLIAVVALATLAPARGTFAHALSIAVDVSIVALFFVHGLKTPWRAIYDGVNNPRLHTLILSGSFLLFPAMGLFFFHAFKGLIGEQLATGLLFLSCLPSTVQSSIAFTSIARGNVPGAICAASLSNLLGVIITPVLVALLLSKHASVSWQSVLIIIGQIVAPFALGQILQRFWTPAFLRKKTITFVIDRGSVLLMVYAAFSKSVVQGIWNRVSPQELALLFVVAALMLAVILFAMRSASIRLGLSKEDEIAAVFCGSKKSLITGVPIANVLFAGATAGAVILPLMIFHQLQLFVCAMLAGRYAQRADASQAAK
ncbi:MAG: bile acid:sodium symporter family protein [Caulobacterales bacterium]